MQVKEGRRLLQKPGFEVEPATPHSQAQCLKELRLPTQPPHEVTVVAFLWCPHQEIVAALECKCNIVPIIDNFEWPPLEKLPEDMHGIVRFNCVRLVRVMVSSARQIAR